MATRKYCAMLRTKTAYYRTPEGERIFDPESTTACYVCLNTQRPFGPDGEPADAAVCGTDRECYAEEQ
jgi:hypothetical protein